MNTDRKNFIVGDEFEVPPWLDRVLDRAVGLEGQRRRWFGVWVQRFRRYCREPGHSGLGFVPLARAYLEGLLITPGVEDWQREQAREALRLFYREIENWQSLKPAVRGSGRRAEGAEAEPAADGAGPGGGEEGSGRGGPG